MQKLFFYLTLSFVFNMLTPWHVKANMDVYEIKAAYLYNFAKFIDWPEDAFVDSSSPLTIGVLGSNPFNGQLNQLIGKKSKKRSIKVEYYTDVTTIGNCHILFVADSEVQSMDAILRELRYRPIVTVSDNKKFARKGGMIEFVMVRNRLRFIINLNRVKQGRLKIDSRLLTLASDVLEGDR